MAGFSLLTFYIYDTLTLHIFWLVIVF